MTQLSYWNHPLVARINALRFRVRLLLAIFGTAVVVASLFGTILLLGVADFLIHLPPLVRMALLGLTALGIVGLAVWKLVLPLTTRLTDQFLASRVERIEKSLADELMAGIHFLRAGLPEQNVLARKAVESIERRASKVPFEEALDSTSTIIAAIAAGVSVLVVIAVAALAPHLTGIALARWTDFNGNHPWPKHTDVALDWPNGQPPAVHPLGDPLRIRAKVTRGGSQNMRVFLYYSTENQREAREIMNSLDSQSDSAKGEFVFQKDIEVGEAQVAYVHVTAGDDRESRPATAAKIRLAPRPAVGAVSATITPPPYVRDPADPTKPGAAHSYNLLESVARAIEGSTVTLRIKSSKPLFADAQRHPDVRLVETGTDKPLPIAGLAANLLDDYTAEVTFPAAKSLEFQPIVRDTDGFVNRAAPTARIEVVPDAQPSVVIVEPRGQMTVPATAQIDVKIQATDDLGLSEVYLEAVAFSAKPGDAPLFRKQLAWGKQVADPASQTVSSTSEHAWDLKGMNLKDGDRIMFYALVRDNYAMPARPGPDGADQPVDKPLENTADHVVRHQLVKSASLTLQIASKEKIMDMTRADLQAIKEQIKNLHNQQTGTNERTKAIQKSAAQAGVTTQQQRDELAKLATEQNTEAQRANAIKDRIDQLLAQMKTSKIDETDLGKVAKEASEGMKDVGQKNMPTAAGELSKAQDSSSKGAAATQSSPSNNKPEPTTEKKAADQVADSTGKADVEQEKALATMQDLMNKLDQTGAVSKARDKVNELLDRQNKSLDNIRSAAKDLMGADPSKLTPEQKKKLDDIKNDQDKLANETANLIKDMQKDAANLSKSDPASAETLNKAADKGNQNNVPGQQSAAGSAAKSNQTSQAANSAQSASKGLSEMKDQLDQQDQRKLEQLARELEDLLRVITQHRDDQTAIKGDTEKAGNQAAATALKPLGDREDRLNGNTLSTRNRVSANTKLRPVASDLKTAADAMVGATVSLFKGKQPESIQPQDDAIAALNEAIAKLEKEKKKVDDQLKDKDLAAFRKEYEAIKAKQEALKKDTDDIAKRKETRGELLTADQNLLGKKSKEEGDLSDSVSKLSQDEKLSKYEVIVWINSQITESMDTAKDKLGKAQVGTQVASAQQNAIDRLDDIINALKEEQARKKDNFERDSNKGGGGGGGGKPPLIPPVAQLKLLKSQQMVVNAGTTKTHKDIEAAKTDEQKAELKDQTAKLGERQDKIKTIAQKIVDDLKK